MIQITSDVVVYLAVSVFSFSLGIVVGWLSAGRLPTVDEDTLRMVLAILLTSLYIVSVGAEIGITAYSTPILLHGIMGGIVGYLFSGDGVNVNIGG